MEKLFKNKKIRVLSGIVAGIVFLVVIYFVSIWDDLKQNTKQPVSTQVKKEETKKEEPAKKYSNISIGEIKYQDGKIVVNGSTDLPNNSKLTVRFNVAGRSDKDTYIGVDKEVIIQDNKFAAELNPPNRQEFTTGKYVVEVLFTPRGQSQDIINLVGEDGENLIGDNVKRNDMLKFNVLEVSKQVNLQLNIKIKSYPMVDVSSYDSNTPERTLAEFLTSWKEQKWENMANYTQLTWRNSAKNPSEELKSQRDFKKLLGAEIKDKKINDYNITADITAIIYYESGRDIYTKTITARIIREVAPHEPSVNGQWGVNPISIMREE